MSKDEQFMRRALELASAGLGKVSPNPMVGCVIVHEEKIIGEGWHQEYGGPHAEVNAIASVKDESLFQEATAYVTLEPCSHHGKTPPCADLLVEKKIKRVVVANRDPFPLVDGSGIGVLQKNGVDVDTELLSEEGHDLNRRFLTFHKKERPFVILKWAQTADGFIAKLNGDSKWISSEPSRKLVHKWRTEEDAILVGANTARQDNPRLTARDWPGKNPLRVVIDRDLRLPQDLNLFDGSTKTLCYNASKSAEGNNVEWVSLGSEFSLVTLLDDLYKRQVQSIIIEGGSKTINKFLEMNLWDEARVFKSQAEFGEGIAAPVMESNTMKTSKVGQDQLLYYRNH